MADPRQRRLERLLRKRRNPREISFHELFFDLAMIFALTRVAQRVLDELTLLNITETLVLFAAVWWVWIATAWSTDWFNPDEPYLQRLIIGIMFAGLLMAAAVPNAYGSHGLLFAGAYTAIHLGRGLVILPALRGHPLQARSARVMIWFGVSAVPWLIGALLPASPRLALWAVAIVIDGASAWFGWPVPGLGRLPVEYLRVVGEHIAERYREIYIISLGAPLLVSGLVYSGAGFDYFRTVAFALTFASTLLLLWSYFLPYGNSLGTIVNKTHPRTAVTAAYCHGLMIAGVAVTAVGNEMLVRQPVGDPPHSWTLVVVGGFALHAIGRTLFGILMFEARRPWRGPVALVVVVGLTPALFDMPLLVVAGLVVAVHFCLVLSLARVRTPASTPAPG
ncbi:low temperature requirement protein A [Micromonospora sp. NPDC049559]|uniref:low temperature requirement protein A n=1 Tax=Micromonospora sp. NPDC049559 TaxID=3155923 RepID=UPI0034345524